MKTKLLLAFAICFCLISNTQAQTLPAYLPADGLVGWWPFNGNANDESGNGNDGTVNGSTLTADRFGSAGSAYSFDGVNDYIQTSFSGIPSKKSRSFSFWFKGTNSSEKVILSYGSDTSIPYSYFNVWTGWQCQGISADIGFAAKTYNSQINNLNWNHYVVVVDTIIGQTLNDIQIFENGQLLSSSCYIVGGETELNTQLTFPLTMGKIHFLDNNYLNGSLDDIAIYNRALSQEEITALYTGEPVNPPTACNPLPSNLQNGLVGYWPFCGNANDESGNGNNGTVNGANSTEDRFGVSGSAYSFDGIGDNVLIDSMPFCVNYTFNCWLRCDTIFTPYPEIYNTSNANENNRLHLVGNIYPFNEQGKVFTGDDNNGNLATSTSKVNDNNWNMITVIYDYTNSNVKLLVNGEVEATETIINPSTFEGALKFGNGFSQQPNPQPFDSKGFVGHLDDIGIWNRALTADEVQELYTLNACTFTIYDTVTVVETIYDTVSVSTTDTLIINTLITGVQPAQENTFLVYPNPAGSQITINNGNVSILGGYTMRISNSIGQEVYNQNITQTEVTLDLSNWGGNGLYVLYILDPQGEIIAVKQIVLQ